MMITCKIYNTNLDNEHIIKLFTYFHETQNTFANSDNRLRSSI